MFAAGALASAWVFTPPSALGECLGADPWPSFRASLPTAERIIVGAVVDDRDPNSSLYLAVFGLRVDEVLRGPRPAEPTLEIANLRSGLPSKGCPSPARVLLDDVIAIAFDARSPAGDRINAVAYIAGTPDPDLMPGVETLALVELRQLAGSAPRAPAAPETTLVLAVFLVVGLVATAIAVLLFTSMRRAARS